MSAPHVTEYSHNFRLLSPLHLWLHSHNRNQMSLCHNQQHLILQFHGYIAHSIDMSLVGRWNSLTLQSQLGNVCAPQGNIRTSLFCPHSVKICSSHFSQMTPNNSCCKFNRKQTYFSEVRTHIYIRIYRGADKSLARPGRKQATATENFDFQVSYL